MYTSIFDSAIRHHEGSHAYSLHRAIPTPRIRNGIASGAVDSIHTSLGEQRLHAIREILENGFTWKRSKTQTKFHEAFLNACVRFLYSEDTNAPDYTSILAANKWTDLRQQVLCMTPRRFGKTVSVGMFVTAMALVSPCEQAIFSTGRRASSKLLELVGQLVGQVPGGQERIIKCNQEMIWLSHPNGRVSKISSYPSCAKVRNPFPVYTFRIQY
tara:strand:+ start:18420 stop:19061 length:642 start_codon:yes stop_codon:yes gene_type:complete